MSPELLPAPPRSDPPIVTPAIVAVDVTAPLLLPIPPTTSPFTNPADWFVPRFPEKMEDLDVTPGFLADLTLKVVR